MDRTCFGRPGGFTPTIVLCSSDALAGCLASACDTGHDDLLEAGHLQCGNLDSASIVDPDKASARPVRPMSQACIPARTSRRKVLL
jgi:hypothetical protein